MITIEPPSTISNPALSASTQKRTHSRACLALILCATVPAMAASKHRLTDWRLTWSDEFNAPNGSSPDPAKWNIVTGGDGFGNGELETYTGRPTNIQQRDGNLVITAQKEDLTGPDGISRNYTSARINTKGLFSQTYGRFEARIQLPIGKAIWPAFWLLGNERCTAEWPDCGEIDILESIGAPDTIYSTLHGPGYSGRQGISTKYPLPAGESIHTSFHLYAVEWTPSDIKFFFDDHLIAHRTPADLPPNTAWIFDHPFYIILNLAVGGFWPGKPDATTTFPQQMLVDYVRVYSRKPGPSAAATKPGAPHLDSEMRVSSEPGSPASAFACWRGEGRPSPIFISGSKSHEKPSE